MSSPAATALGRNNVVGSAHTRWGRGPQTHEHDPIPQTRDGIVLVIECHRRMARTVGMIG